MSAYLLIANAKKGFYLYASLYTCLQIMSVSEFERSEVPCALQ
jgi:hypothetical protein